MIPTCYYPFAVQRHQPFLTTDEIEGNCMKLDVTKHALSGRSRAVTGLFASILVALAMCLTGATEARAMDRYPITIDTLAKATATSVPATGDTTSMTLIIILLVVAVVACVLGLYLKRKNRDK